MTNQDSRAKDAADLRQKAEALARARIAQAPKDSATLSLEEIRQTLHELRVHQIELEMQNEELRAAQTEIEAGRARYFDLYNLAPVGYCTLSEQGLILEANLTAATLLGTARGALIKQPISSFILKDDQDIYYLHRKKLFETGENQKCELRLVKADGAHFWAHLTGSAVQTEDGTPLCRMVLSDISERKLAEEENAKLQARLTEARKMESVGRLAGGVAHEFNNMMGIILGFTELALEQTGPDEPLHADLEEILQAARRSADLTQQLLVFARKQTIAPQVLDLGDTVEGLLDMLRRLIGENIALHWEPGRDLWPVKMDPAQIEQMLTNLCANARDAVTGFGTISVKTGNTVLDEEYCARQADSTPGEYVALTVSDDGCGMDSKTLASLFDPFFTTKEMGRGTGLGLAIVYGIVKQNNGFIKVHSVPGKGTTFTLYLPRHTHGTQTLQGKITVQAVPSDRETILLVEEEPAIMKMTKIALERWGYTVLAAPTPGKAITLAREYPGRLGLLITDVIMPEMSGRQLVRNLSSICPNLKHLFMAGCTGKVIAHHAGVPEEKEHILQKPFSLKDLGTKLRQILEDQ